MNRLQRWALKSIAATITAIIVFLIVRALLFNDFLTSLQPGWHTTIHPFGTPLELTIIILVFTLIAYMLFKYVLRALTIIYISFFNRRDIAFLHFVSGFLHPIFRLHFTHKTYTSLQQVAFALT